MDFVSWLTTAVDQYCERTSSSWDSEPLNALSNLPFILFAFYLYNYPQRHFASNPRPPFWNTIVVMLGIVGIGSGLFHTFANNLTMILDVVPIVILALLLLFALVTCKTRDSRKALGLVIMHFVGLAATTTSIIYLLEELNIRPWLNGSENYFGLIIYLMGLSIFLKNEWLAASALVLINALLSRSLDIHLCDQLPSGTHFMWHILSAFGCALAIRGYLLVTLKRP